LSIAYVLLKISLMTNDWKLHWYCYDVDHSNDAAIKFAKSHRSWLQTCRVWSKWYSKHICKHWID